MKKWRRSLALLAGVVLASWASPVLAQTRAVRAGTIHVVDGPVVRDGTILITDGRIAAVGTDLVLPPGTKVTDYGPDAVIVPGLVSAMSWYANGSPSKRTADPAVRAIDGYDFYHPDYGALAAGVTTSYVTPSDRRLIAGQGALVKMAGDDRERRIVNGAAALHGAVDSAARNAPGYWEPPLPATVDVGIGSHDPQLPKTTMGAIVALNELLDAGRSRRTDTGFGPRAPQDLVELLDKGVPLRLGAVEENEIRAVLDFAGEREVRVLLDKATEAGPLAPEIARAGLGVIYRVDYNPNQRAIDRGRDEDARWFSFDAPSELLAAGVRVAITGDSPRDLLFLTALALRGGLSSADGLRAITLTPAELLGGDARIGSITPGKDADLCVLNAPPLEGPVGVLATWVDGRLAWWPGMEMGEPESSFTTRKKRSRKEARRRAASAPTVIEVDELHVGDGTVLRPGGVVLRDGKVIEVGERVSYPPGARVVRGTAAMPGMIDAFGHLGLEGSRRVPATDYELSQIVEPGDRVDRRVASHGITTVVMTPRGASGSGVPILAYKPAGDELEQQVIADPVALRLTWRDSVRARSGEDLAKLLKKAHDYKTAWREYEEAMSKWTPPEEEAKAEDEDGEDEKEEDEDEEEEEDDDKKKKKKRKKKGEEELEPDPVTGTWLGSIGDDRLRLRLLFKDGVGSGALEGNLRCKALSEALVMVRGSWDREERKLSVSGLGSRGGVLLQLEWDDKKLVGTATTGVESHEVELERESRDYPVARRPERRPVKEEKKKDPKGKPKEPKRDAKLEPLVRAMDGEGTIVVEVSRADEIRACVDLCESFGIAPVLFGADEAYKVVDEIAGRVAGVLLSEHVVVRESRRGIEPRMPYNDLQRAGIPVAFSSESEEGAADLPLRASYAVANGMNPSGAVRALTLDAARMMHIDDRVGLLQKGKDADVLLLDGPPLLPGTSILRAWVNGKEIR